VTCNDVTANRTDPISRLEHVSFVVGLGRVDLRSGRSIWVYGGGGLPSRRSALASPDRREPRFLCSKCLIGLRTCPRQADSPLPQNSPQNRMYLRKISPSDHGFRRVSPTAQTYRRSLSRGRMTLVRRSRCRRSERPETEDWLLARLPTRSNHEGMRVGCFAMTGRAADSERSKRP